MTTSAVTPVIASFTVSARLTNENSARETRAHREARAKADFGKAKSITFLGRLDDATVAVLAKGGDVAVAGYTVTYLKGAGKCSVCGGTHQAAQSAKTTWYRNEQTKAQFALSDTCRQDYLAPQGIERVLTNPDVYRTVFPKAVTK